MLKFAALLVVTVSLFMSSPASAQSKSWNAIKGSIHPKATIVMGANFEPIRKTAAFAAGMKMLLDAEPDAGKVFETVKTVCGFGVDTAASDVTMVMMADKKPLVVVGLNNLDESKLVTCMEQVVAKMASIDTFKLSAKKKGKVTEYSAQGEAKKLYFAWLAKDVVAFSDDPNMKGRLEKMLAGKAAKGALGKLLGKTNPTAPIWAAVAVKTKEDGIAMNGGYGWLTINGSTLEATARILVGAAAEASKAVEMGKVGIEEAKTKAAKSPAVLKLLNTIKMTANGSEVELTGSIADKDVITVLPEFEGAF